MSEGAGTVTAWVATTCPPANRATDIGAKLQRLAWIAPRSIAVAGRAVPKKSSGGANVAVPERRAGDPGFGAKFPFAGSVSSGSPTTSFVPLYGTRRPFQ